jgi:hypothetical protein
MSISSRFAGAALGAVLALGIGSAGLAYAQDSTSSTPSTTDSTTVAPADGQTHDPANCPKMGEGGGPGGPGGPGRRGPAADSGDSTTTTPSGSSTAGTAPEV